MKIAYEGPLLDYSGYGEANRHAVAALKAAGVDVVGKLLTYASERADYGTMGPIMHEVLENKDTDYKIKIMHTTPDEFYRLTEPGKYHIAHFFWETDRVPTMYAEAFKHVDEIWTGSLANKKALENAGVDKPIVIFPQATETEREWPPKYELPDFDGYLFYSIFEWTDRKNPKALINAFYQEFQQGESVGLLIKTYFRNFSFTNKKMIRNAVQVLKDQYDGELPPVFLYLDLMDRQQIMRIHSTGDCFVSAHRGEGWGVPQVEATLAGNPIISTGYGGMHEYFTDGKDAVLLPYKMQQLRGMDHAQHIYTPDQKWAEVDHDKLRGAMRWAFNNQEDAAYMGRKGQRNSEKQFNFKVVGRAMAERLKDIEAKL